LSYDIDRAIEDKFAGQIKSALANHFITKVEQDDLERGRDFAIYYVEPFSVAVRLRRYDYFEAFSHQFTIRWSRPSGVRTEIDKIRDREVQYLFYGFLSPTQTYLIQYFIADLSKFGDQEPIKIVPNNPYDSELAVYDLSQFSSSFIVKFWCHPEFERKKNLKP
jgi:hypothetical protein